jgi:hypothetical protein
MDEFTLLKSVNTTTSDNTKPKKCYNCKHSGRAFKLGKVTHMHCEHPDTPEEPGWGTLMEFWQTCDMHEFKNQ